MSQILFSVDNLMSSNLLLTGASGYLGSAILAEVLPRGTVNVLSLARSRHPLFRSSSRLSEFDVSTPFPAMCKRIQEFNPFACIHCAALASSQACEERPAEAEASNVGLTKLVIEACRECRVPLCHISTDLVFDGIAKPPPLGGLTESEPVQPSSVYARSKAAAECLVLEQCPEAAVVRLALLYGPEYGLKRGPLGWMKDALREGRDLELFEDEYRSPLYVVDAARSVFECAKRGLSGVYHLGGPERVSRVHFGEAFLAAFGGNLSQIRRLRRADRPSVPPRPKDVSLNSSKICRELGVSLSGVREGLEAAAVSTK